MTSTTRPVSTFDSPSHPSQRPRPRPLTLDSPKRQPLGAISVQSFQQRHRTEFAHLHQHSDEHLREKRIQAEKEGLEEARRIGRQKRESLMSTVTSPPSAYTTTTNNDIDNAVFAGGAGRVSLSLDAAGYQEELSENGLKRGSWKPLNLVQKRSGQAGGDVIRARSVSNGPSSARVIRPLSLLQTSTVRRHTASLHARSSSIEVKSLPAALEAGDNSILAVAGDNGLNVVVETETSSPAPLSEELMSDDVSPSEVSVIQSSYSWASQFSGETEELRAAAHYVSKSGDQTDSQNTSDGEEEAEDDTLPGEAGKQEVLTTPEKGTARRRKKIVALAHTVRQLEGVGSREPEDPAFFPKLVKAWNERPGLSPSEPSLENSSDAGTSAMMSGSSPRAPPTPLFPNERDPIIRRHLSLSNGDSGSPEFEYDYGYHPEEQSRNSLGLSSMGRQSNRYSYASTLHDLALDGGIQQATKLMAEKPWLRGSITGNTSGGYPGAGVGYDNFALRPLSYTDFPVPPSADIVQSGHLAAPVDLDNGRTLRKAKPSVGRLAADNALTDAPPGLLLPPPLDAPATSDWGVGLLSNWWNGTAASPTETQLPRDQSTRYLDAADDDSDIMVAVSDEQDFHKGEDGKSQAMLSTMTTSEQSFHSIQELASLTPLPATPQLHPVEPSLSVLLPGQIQTLALAHAHASPSSNPCQPPTCSTHSITSYLPTLTTPSAVHNKEEQTVIVEEGSVSTEGGASDSSHSLETGSSPSKRMTLSQLPPLSTAALTQVDSTWLTLQLKSPEEIMPHLVKEFNGEAGSPTQELTGVQGEGTGPNFDQEFLNALKIAQSISIPTPTIRSPQVSASATLESPSLTYSIQQLSAASPGPSSSHQSLDNEEDMEIMDDFVPDMATAPTRASTLPNPRTSSIATSALTSPLVLPARSVSSPTPDPSSPTIPVIFAVSPLLIDTRRPQRPRTSSLNLLNSPSLNAVAGPSAIVPSSPAVYEESILASPSLLSPPGLEDVDFDAFVAGMGASPSVNSFSASSRRVTLNDSSSTLGRPSRYQQYQNNLAERNRRANSRVAARMSGLPPPMTEREKRKSRAVALEDALIQEHGVAEPSKMAIAMFVLGFLGPWFWILGGWLPAKGDRKPKTSGAASAATTDREKSPESQTQQKASPASTSSKEMPSASNGAVDVEQGKVTSSSDTENLGRWKRWINHPDPWVRRCRMASLIGGPIWLCAIIGVGIGIAFAVPK